MPADKLNIVSCVLFTVANIFAISSICIPKWVVSSLTSVRHTSSHHLDRSIDKSIGGSGGEGRPFESVTTIGLLTTCVKKYSESKETCFTPSVVQPEWVAVFSLIVLGILCVSLASAFLVLYHLNITRPHIRRRSFIKAARAVGFAGMVLFCLAAVIFPIGFDTENIGGSISQLPSNYHVGISYILFVLAMWLTVISELFAGKVCLPRF